MRRQQTLLIAILALFLASCDPEKTINSYFRDLGLNRLAVPRSDVEPGGLVIVKGNKAFYEGSVYDWLAGDEFVGAAVIAADRTSDYAAILKKYKGERKMSADVAIGVMQKVVPVDISAAAGLQGNVEIEMVKALGRRVKVADLEKLLNSKAAAELRLHLEQVIKDGAKPYVMFEALRTNKLKITSNAGSDVSASLKVGEVKPIANAKASVSVKRTSQSVLEIEGDQPYVFAVRTAFLKKSGNLWRVDITNYAPPSDWGIKAAGTDEKHSAFMTEESAVELTVGPYQSGG